MKRCNQCKKLVEESKLPKDRRRKICNNCRDERLAQKAILKSIRSEKADLLARGKKKCCGCGNIKLVKEFYTANGELYGSCKLCHDTKSNAWCKSHPERRRQIFINSEARIKYGISGEEYTRLTQSAKTCDICKESLTRPHLDHDHESGKVRGVLCFNCNGGLGQFKDSPERLRSAANYLENASLTIPNS